MVLATYVSAQTEQGRWMLSGKTGMNFNHSLSEILPRQTIQNSTTTSQFSITPAVGYFVADNLAVNLSANFESKKEDESSTKITQNSFSVLPGLVYYVPTNSQFRPFVEAGAGYAMTKISGGGNSGKLGGFAFGGGLGVSYFVNNYISIDLAAQYSQADLKPEGNTDAKLRTQGLTGLIGFSLFL